MKIHIALHRNRPGVESAFGNDDSAAALTAELHDSKIDGLAGKVKRITGYGTVFRDADAAVGKVDLAHAGDYPVGLHPRASGFGGRAAAGEYESRSHRTKKYSTA